MVLLDASVIIYLLEGNSVTRASVQEVLRGLMTDNDPPLLAVSALSRLECRVRPLREGNAPLLERYDTFFDDPGLLVVPLDAAVVDRATELRARYRLRTPDALQAASLLAHDESGCLVTGDGDFSGIPQLQVCQIEI